MPGQIADVLDLVFDKGFRLGDETLRKLQRCFRGVHRLDFSASSASPARFQSARR